MTIQTSKDYSVDLMLEAIYTSPSINAATAWEEVKAERRRERA